MSENNDAQPDLTPEQDAALDKLSDAMTDYARQVGGVVTRAVTPTIAQAAERGYPVEIVVLATVTGVCEAAALLLMGTHVLKPDDTEFNEAFNEAARAGRESALEFKARMGGEVREELERHAAARMREIRKHAH